tara:strand:+ start:6612 stop:7457 length:846 start_codon:yes stop_codon:yes gene_type:complete
MNQNYQFQGIDGLGKNAGSGRNQAWGAVVTIGEKDSKRGNPTATDKFFIKKPQAVTKKINGRSTLIRENDPDFVRYNDSQNPSLRQTIRFNIVHPIHLRDGWQGVADAFHFQLKAFQIPGTPVHEKSIPACVGDGKKARRWDGKEFKDIDCPNHLCKFREGRPSPCKPFARLAFQLRWDQNQPWGVLPTPLTKFETKSWYNIDRVLMPFFAGLHKQAIALGLQNYTLYGLPAVIKLGKRIAGRGNVVPAVSVATDFPPGMTLQSFFLQQKQFEVTLGIPSD